MSLNDYYIRHRNMILDNQHHEKMNLQRQIHAEKMSMQERILSERKQAEQEHNQTLIKVEEIAGENDQKLECTRYLMDMLRKNDEFTNQIGTSLLGESRDWSQNIGNIMANLLQIKANLIANQKLNEQNHRHRMLEMQAAAEIAQDQSILESKLKNENLTDQELLKIAIDLLRQSSGLSKNLSADELSEAADKLARSVYSPY